MSSVAEKRNWVRLTLGILQVFIGLGGVAGGVGLVADPSGANAGMSTEILAGSPFADFLIPGLVLLAVNGLGTLVGAFLTFSRRPSAAEIALVLGTFLMAWIAVQVYLIGLVHWLQPLFFALGLMEFNLGRLLRRSAPLPVDSSPI